MLFDHKKSNDKAEKSAGMKYRVYMALLSDVDIDNFPKAVNATISTNVLLPGKVYRYMDCHVNSVKPSAAAGAAPHDAKLTVPIVIDGISKKSLQWVYDNNGEDVVLIWERCADGQKFIGGSPCSSGLTIKLKTIGEVNNLAAIELSLEGGDCPEPFWFYDGPIVREEPTVINLGAETTFALTAATQFTIADNAAAKSLTDITGVTDADVGRVFQLIGAGVNHPALIETSDIFIMKSGLSFSLALGNTIDFAISKTVDGYIFVELDRS